jgi:carboxymethylenebutenolidase
MAILRKRPAAEGSWPTVVMFHDGPGIRNATHEFACKLAGQGYDVVVPDLYHREGRMLGWELHEREADPSIMDRLGELMRSLSDDGIQHDLDAALAAVGVDVTADEPLLTIGFCLGARAVAHTMVRFPERFAAGAMWHPSFLVDDTPTSPHLRASELSAPLFIGIGAVDQIQPLAGHRPYLEAVETKPGVDIEVFTGADHGYTWPGWPNYDPAAAEVSFERTVALFRSATAGAR